MLSIVVGVTLVVLVLDVWTSISLLRSEVFTGSQKAAQLIFVLLIPLLGAIVSLWVSRESDAAPVRRGSMDSGPEAGIALGGDLGGTHHGSSDGGHS